MIGFVRSLYTDPDCEKQLAILNSIDCLIVLDWASISNDHQFTSHDVARCLLPKETLAISHLAVLGSSLKEVMHNLVTLQEHDISVITVREQLNLDPFTSELFVEFLLIMEDFHTDILRENTRRGMEEAKQKGKKTGRPKKNEKSIEEALQLYHSREMSLEEIQDKTGISRSTLYRYLQQS